MIRSPLKPKLNLRLRLFKGLGSPVMNVSVKENSLLVSVLKFFGILADQCGSVTKKEREGDERSRFVVWV